jgi:cyclopropane fatty-acyl-phospholipid synthase-like methyltransferase
MLYYAAETWHAASTLSGDVLDVGCGLGGGAIFWAQEFGARVTAVTCVPSHAPWVSRFAAQAGVESRVRTLVCDAVHITGEETFDAVVAVDSSGYLPRREWFGRLSALLRPAGRVFLVDCFLEGPKFQESFDRYWHTQIGSLSEYLTEAERAGLASDSIEDISPRTAHFWTTTQALIRAEAQERSCSPQDQQSVVSLRAHKDVLQGLTDGGLRYALLSFRKSEARVISV